MTLPVPPKCLYCDKPATLALRGKNNDFNIYMCWDHLMKNMREKLKVKKTVNAEIKKVDA